MRRLIFSILIIGAAACKSEKAPPIAQDKFTDLLIDLSASEALYSKIYDTDTAAVRTIAIRNQQILNKHNVSKEDFVTTYHYYDDHKEDLLQIYKTAIDSAAARKDRLQSLK